MTTKKSNEEIKALYLKVRLFLVSIAEPGKVTDYMLAAETEEDANEICQAVLQDGQSYHCVEVANIYKLSEISGETPNVH